MNNRIGIFVLLILLLVATLISCDDSGETTDTGINPELQEPGLIPGEENKDGTTAPTPIEPQPNPVPQPDPTPDLNPTPEPSPAPDTNPQPQPQPTPDTNTTPTPDNNQNPDADPEPAPDINPDTQPDSPPEQDTETNPDVLYTVKFDFGYGGIVNTEQTSSKIAVTETPLRKGYKFLGWYYENNLWNFENSVSSDISLVAKWEIINFKITYNLGTAENHELNPTSYNVENLNVKLFEPVNSSGVFVAWYLDSDFSIPFEIKEPYSDLTAYAKFAFPSEFITYEKIDGAYYVSGYTGNEDVIIIPDTYQGASVIGILDYAFADSEAYKIILPSSIKYIQKDAFSSCCNLAPLEYDGLKYMGTLENDYFALLEPIEEIATGTVNIHNECVLICDSAFRNQSISSVLGGESVKFIGDSAFRGARSLLDVEIFDTVLEIGESAFASCVKLKNLSFENDIYSIGKSAFSFCEGIRYLKLAGKITKIPERAFESCNFIETVIISDNIEYIGANAFRDISDAANIYYMGTSEDWEKINLNSNFEMNEDFIFFNYTSGN